MVKGLNIKKDESLKIFAIVFAAGILSRLLLLGISVIMMHVFNVQKNLMEMFANYCDAPHYLYIAENGYASSGEMANRIVFYPLFPLLMRIFSYVFRSYTFSGLFISYAAFGFASAYLYKLMRLDFDFDKSMDALLLFFMAPFGFFFQSVYTESLFLMFSIAAVYYARKENWILASVLGFFAALTKTQGMLIVVPVVYELIICCVRDRKLNKKGISGLLIPMGFVVYLCINKIVLGEFFAFTAHQEAAPWYNSAKWVSEGLATSYRVGMENYSLSWIIYWPQITAFFVSITMIFAGIRKKVRTSYLAFMGVYILETYLQGWMISGARYVTSCFVIYTVMASIDNRLLKYLMYFVSGTLCIYYTVLCIQGYAIM